MKAAFIFMDLWSNFPLYSIMVQPLGSRTTGHRVLRFHLFIRFTVHIFRERFVNFVCVLLSLLVLGWDVGFDCVSSCLFICLDHEN